MLLDTKKRTTIEEIIISFEFDKESKILDAACGVGNIGKALRNNGYRNIDGLDPIQGYLEVAAKIYDQTYKEFIDDERPTSIPDNYYDICVCGAGFFSGLIPLKGIYELLRISKTGGLVIWSIAESKDDSEKNEHFDIIEDLSARNSCEIVEKIACDRLAFTDSGAAYLSGYQSGGIETRGTVYVVRKK